MGYTRVDAARTSEFIDGLEKPWLDTRRSCSRKHLKMHHHKLVLDGYKQISVAKPYGANVDSIPEVLLGSRPLVFISALDRLVSVVALSYFISNQLEALPDALSLLSEKL